MVPIHYLSPFLLTKIDMCHACWFLKTNVFKLPLQKKIKTIKTIFLKLYIYIYIYKRVGGGRNQSYMLFEGG
jgi:hypothetical protein